MKIWLSNLSCIILARLLYISLYVFMFFHYNVCIFLFTYLFNSNFFFLLFFGKLQEGDFSENLSIPTFAKQEKKIAIIDYASKT